MFDPGWNGSSVPARASRVGCPSIVRPAMILAVFSSERPSFREFRLLGSSIHAFVRLVRVHQQNGFQHGEGALSPALGSSWWVRLRVSCPLQHGIRKILRLFSFLPSGSRKSNLHPRVSSRPARASSHSGVPCEPPLVSPDSACLRTKRSNGYPWL